MPTSKYDTIRNWKLRGLIYDDYDELYEIYIKTMECQHCNKEFKDSHDRCMDHDHNTGLFRKIVCQTCNCCDIYIKHPNGYDVKEYRKSYIQKYRNDNKERITQTVNQYKNDNLEEINQKRKQKITCLCGSVISIRNKSVHLKTERHLNNMDLYMENID